MVKSALLRTQNTVLSAALILAVAGGMGAFLGLVKGRLLAYYFGVSDDLAVFYTADRIPSLIYSVLVIGAVSTIFIPVFSQEYKKNKKQAWEMSSSMILGSILFFLVLGTIIFALAPQIISLLALGRFTDEQVRLGADLMRIMLVSQAILVISSFITCILQSFKYFLIPATAPILYSLGMIIGTVLLAPTIGIYGPAWGVMIGAFLHLLVQIPVLKHTDFTLSAHIDLQNKGVREIFSLTPPRILSVLIANTIATVSNSMAILVSSASVVHLKFANQLQFFPVNLFGISIASAVLPTLSTVTDEENLDKFKSTFLTSLHQMLFLVIPLSVMFLVLRIPIIRLVYGVSTFPWDATIKTAYALAFYSLSIFSQSAVYLITRAFYALKDTKTPVIVSSATVFLNVILSVVFIKYLGLGVWSIAFAFSITSIVDMLSLLYLLAGKVGGFSLQALIVPFVKVSYSAVIMGIFLYVPLKFLDEYVFDTTRTINLLVLTVIAGCVGMAAYLGLTKLLKVEEIEVFYKLLRKLNISKPKKVVYQEPSTLN
jgi:putative peptidoglycan lipid II flippase